MRKSHHLPAIVFGGGVIVIVFCVLICFPIGIIYYFVHKKQKEQILNSAEYKAQCAEIDAECDRQQAIANQKYEEETRLYETETLPNYQKELDEWTANHEKKSNKCNKI